MMVNHVEGSGLERAADTTSRPRRPAKTSTEGLVPGSALLATGYISYVPKLVSSRQGCRGSLFAAAVLQLLGHLRLQSICSL